MRPPQRALLPRRMVKEDELYAAFNGGSEGIRGAVVGGTGWRMRLSGLLRKVCREKKEPKTLCHLVESHGR